jgi:hypothetical protein
MFGIGLIIQMRLPWVSDEDISEEEAAELELLRAERLRGEGTSHTWEDVQRMAREAIKG